MLISAAWISSYLPKGGISPALIQDALIHAGFPIESATPLEGGDVRLDVEITSNRGDALCHLGLAREVAAKLRLPLAATVPPRLAPGAKPVRDLLTLESRVGDACPRFTARAITGVTVGPSPAWLRERLEAVGQRSINNVVDATNYLNFELGHPCHAFDLARLAGRTLVVRHAAKGESLTTLDGKPRSLAEDDVVIADAQKPQSLAGVMGGADSQVTSATRDLVLEVATWDPVVIRRTSRRHGLRTDASYRYERLVDARSVDAAADRLAALVLEVAGGTLADGVLVAGPPVPPPTRIRLRPARCAAILGVELPAARLAELLARLGIACTPAGADLSCEIPAFRPDLTREIDLIEEVARIEGLDAIPTHERLGVRVKPPQDAERARREVGSLLAGMGFYEATTFSFCSRPDADLFLAPGLERAEVDDERRKAEPVLRPSVLAGLLACRRTNQHAQPALGPCRFFEVASVFAQRPRPGALPESVERVSLAMLLDAATRSRTGENLQPALRAMRGTIEALARALAGTHSRLTLVPDVPPIKAFDPAAFARVELDDTPIGRVGLLSREAQAHFDLPLPAVAAELDFDALVSRFPPRGRVTPLPAYPGIERDVSFVLDDHVPWARVEAEIGRLHAASPPAHLQSWRFIGSFRGGPIGAGKKSVTVRFAFRDPARTLRHEEVDRPIADLSRALASALGGSIRA